MENFLTTYPDINLVLLTDDGSGIGAYNAIKSAGLLNKIKIVGIGGTNNQVFQYIKDGTLDSTIYLGLEMFGNKLVDVSNKIFKGEKIDYNQTIDIVVVDKTNVDKYLTK